MKYEWDERHISVHRIITLMSFLTKVLHHKVQKQGKGLRRETRVPRKALCVKARLAGGKGRKRQEQKELSVPGCES